MGTSGWAQIHSAFLFYTSSYRETCLFYSYLVFYRSALLVGAIGKVRCPVGALEVPATAMSNIENGKRRVAEETKMLVSFYLAKRRAPSRKKADRGDEEAALEHKLFQWLRIIRQRVRYDF